MVKQGFFNITEGNVIQYAFIENFIDELGKNFNIKEIAFDRWGAVEMFFKIDDSIINDSGVGMLLGILNSDVVVTVSKEKEQSAGI